MANERMKEGMKSTAHALGVEMTGQGGEQPTTSIVELAVVDQIVSGWSETPQKVARRTLDKYGPPNEATPSRLIWFNNGPWKRTIIYRDEVPHNFPKPHTDVLEQFVNYRVPPEKFSAIAQYDGSVVPERTKGEMSARCDMEEMNFLALNLAHEIATGERDVEDARRVYAEQATAFMLKREAPYTERLLFDGSASGTADLDKPKMGPMMKEAVSTEGSRPSEAPGAELR